MQAVHHWHSESLGRETGVPIPHIWQVHAMNSLNLRESTSYIPASTHNEAMLSGAWTSIAQ